MRALLTIGHNDLRQFLRDRSSYLWLFLIPTLFVYVMGFAFRAGPDPANPRPAVLIDNRDAGFLGRVFLDELGVQGVRVVAPADAAQAKRGIRIPADFTARVLAKEQVKVEFFKLAGSDDQSAALVELRLVRALVALNAHLIEAAVTSGGALPTEAALHALVTAPNPVTLDARYAGRRPIPVGYNQSVPGIMVMYLLLNLMIYGGSTVAAERNNGVLRRLCTNPVRRSDVIFGRLYGLMLLAAVQIAWFLALGQFAFHVNIGDHVVGVALVALAFGWVACSLGVLVGSLVRAQDKVVGLCLLVSLPVAALGGCWWPLEITPRFMQVAAHLTPSAWALDGLHQLITFGAGLGAALPAIGVLLAFGLAANLAAVRFFRV
ncbi:MAG TPA: ABC transporter permease [Opitutaceae bacterium]|nr:ABC transporter permease [Opitutaceae bacterium]